jgi:hypothetical protein
MQCYSELKAEFWNITWAKELELGLKLLVFVHAIFFIGSKI